MKTKINLNLLSNSGSLKMFPVSRLPPFCGAQHVRYMTQRNIFVIFFRESVGIVTLPKTNCGKRFIWAVNRITKFSAAAPRKTC